MRSLGLMGRVAVSFFVSTVLPIVLFFLSTRGRTDTGLRKNANQAEGKSRRKDAG